LISALSLRLGSYVAGPIIKGKTAAAVAKELRARARATFLVSSAMDANASLDKLQYGNHKPIWITDR
jgi:hypothetical protein